MKDLSRYDDYALYCLIAWQIIAIVLVPTVYKLTQKQLEWIAIGSVPAFMILWSIGIRII